MGRKLKIYKIGAVVGVVGTVVGTTLGVHYGFKNKGYSSNKELANNPAKRFFDDNLSSSTSTYLSEHIVSPSNGHILSTYITTINNNDFKEDNIRRFISKDSSGNYIKLLTKNISINSLTSRSDIDRELAKINEEIYQYVETNIISKMTPGNNFLPEQYGIYTYANANTRDISVSLYKLNSIKDNDPSGEIINMINDFVHDLGEINLRTVTPDYFFQPFSSETCLSPEKYEEWYHWNFGENISDSDFSNKRSNARKAFYDKWNGNQNGTFDVNEDKYSVSPDNNNAPWKRAEHDSNNPPEESNFKVFKTLWNKGIVPIMTPLVDFKNNTLNLAIKFKLLDEKSRLVDFEPREYIQNVKAEYTVIKKADLKLLGDKNQLQKNQTNRNLIKKFISEDLANYMKKPLVNPGLQLLGKVIPNITPSIRNLIELGNVFKNHPSAIHMFDNPSASNDPLAPYKGDALLDKIIDLISNNPNFKTNEVVENIIKPFSSNIDNYWGSLEIVSELHFKEENGEASGQYKLYNLLAFIDSFSDTINEAVKKNFPTLEAVQDNSDIINEFLNYLKTEGAINKNVQINDVISNPYSLLTSIFEYARINGLSIPRKYVSIIARIMPQLGLSVSHQEMETLTNSLSDFLASRENLKDLAQFLSVGGKHNVGEIFTNITTDPLKILKIISENRNVDPNFIMKIGKVINAMGILPSGATFLIPDTPRSSQNISKLFNNGTLEKIYEVASKIKQEGINSVTDLEWHSILDDIVANYTEMFGNVSSNQLLNVIKLLINDGLTSPGSDWTQLLRVAFNVADGILGFPVSAVAGQIVTPNFAKSLLTKSIGFTLSPENPNYDTLMLALTAIPSIPSLTNNSLVGQILPIVKSLGRGFSNEEEFIRFFKHTMPNLDYSQSVPVLGDIDSILRKLYSGWTLKIPIIGTVLVDFGGFSNIIQNGLNAATRSDISKIVDVVKYVNGLNGILPEMNEQIQKVLDVLTRDTDLTKEVIYNIIHVPINQWSSEVSKYVVDIIKELTNQGSLDNNFISQILEFLNGGIPSDRALRYHMGKTLANSIAILAGNSSPNSQNNIRRIVEDIIIGRVDSKQEDSIVSSISAVSKVLPSEVSLTNGAQKPKMTFDFTSANNRIIALKAIISSAQKSNDEKLSAYAEIEYLINRAKQYNLVISKSNQLFTERQNRMGDITRAIQALPSSNLMGINPDDTKDSTVVKLPSVLSALRKNNTLFKYVNKNDIVLSHNRDAGTVTITVRNFGSDKVINISGYRTKAQRDEEILNNAIQELTKSQIISNLGFDSTKIPSVATSENNIKQAIKTIPILSAINDSDILVSFNDTQGEINISISNHGPIKNIILDGYRTSVEQSEIDAETRHIADMATNANSNGLSTDLSLKSTIDKSQTFANDLSSDDFILPSRSGYDFTITNIHPTGTNNIDAEITISISSTNHPESISSTFTKTIRGFKAQTTTALWEFVKGLRAISWSGAGWNLKQDIKNYIVNFFSQSPYNQNISQWDPKISGNKPVPIWGALHNGTTEIKTLNQFTKPTGVNELVWTQIHALLSMIK